MTLKLVADNVETLPVYNPKAIPSIARTFADKLEGGEFGEVNRVVVLCETDEGLVPMYWGDDLTHYDAIAMLHLGMVEATERQRAEVFE